MEVASVIKHINIITKEVIPVTKQYQGNGSAPWGKTTNSLTETGEILPCLNLPVIEVLAVCTATLQRTAKPFDISGIIYWYRCLCIVTAISYRTHGGNAVAWQQTACNNNNNKQI
jgi:hypothetical protein